MTKATNTLSFQELSHRGLVNISVGIRIRKTRMSDAVSQTRLPVEKRFESVIASVICPDTRAFRPFWGHFRARLTFGMLQYRLFQHAGGNTRRPMTHDQRIGCISVNSLH